MTINYKKFIRCYFSPTEGGNDKKFNINFSELGVPEFRPGVKAFCVVEHFHMASFNTRFDQPIYICSDLPQPNLIKNTPTTIGGTPGPRAENYGPDNILINLENILYFIGGIGSFRTYQYDMNIIENGLFCILPSNITFTFRWARLGNANNYNVNMAKVADGLITGRFKLILRFYLIEDTIYRISNKPNLTDMGLEYDKYIRVFLSPNTPGNNKTFYIDYSSFSPEFQPGKKVWCAVEHFNVGNGANGFLNQHIYIYSDLPQPNLYLDGSDNSPEHIILNVKQETTTYASYNYNMECIENGFVTILQPSIFINLRYAIALNEVATVAVLYFKLILRFYLLNDDE